MSGTNRPGVSTEVFGPILRRLICEGYDPLFEDGRVEAVAERTGVNPSTIWQIMWGRKLKCDFDIADKLLCALNAVHLWWIEPLKTIYDDLPLFEKCAHQDCQVYYQPLTQQGKGRRKFCSKECAASAKAGNRRVKKQKMKPILGFHAKKCRNGHRRTPESTIVLKSGVIRCRICNNASSARSYHKKKGNHAS